VRPILFLRYASLLAVTSPALACHHHRNYFGEIPSIDGFRFGAYATVVGAHADTLRVNATAENISGHSLQDMWGSCYRLNRLAIVAKAGVKSWDSHAWEIRQQPVYYDSAGRVIAMACGGGVFLQTVRPGGLLRYELRVPVGAILGDSLVQGRYRVVARLVINGREVKNLSAGEVVLRAPTT